MPHSSDKPECQFPEDASSGQGLLAEIARRNSELARCNSELAQQTATLTKQLAEQQNVIEQLKHELLLLRHWRFGAKSERFVNPDQLSLFPDAPVPPAEVAVPETPAEKKPRKGHGRNALPADLPVERVEVELAAEDKICAPCGAEKIRIGEEIRRELDYIPGSVFVREIVRPVFACPKECVGQVTVAANPPAPIEKGLPGPGLLAHVAVNKYHDHLPLHRQEAMLQRMGVKIGRSTLADWMEQSAHLLTTLHEEMKREVLLSTIIHTGDTPVTVQDPKGKTKPHKGRLWIYRGDRRHPYTIYTFSPNRRQEWPTAVLSGWKGYLQANAYQGYNQLFGGGTGMVEAACWAHARRKFVEADKSDGRAKEMLKLIGVLYGEERHLKRTIERLGWSLSSPGPDGDRAEELRRRRRMRKSKPILDRIQAWLRGSTCAGMLPKSPLGEAAGYCRGNWAALCVFAEHGGLEIDNNRAENGLRPVAVGRKNYLFFGSDRGGHTGAVLYGVIQTAKRHGLDPWRYLRDVFKRLPAMTVSQVSELLPDRWRDAHAEK